jgi:hypothetical protein
MGNLDKNGMKRKNKHIKIIETHKTHKFSFDQN